MRVLISVACVAVIAFVGYYFVNSASSERKQFAASCSKIVKHGPPNETASDKRLAPKRLSDCIQFIETGKLP